MTTVRPARIESTTPRSTVTPLELFFDLVFVFAMTQVTAFMAAELTWVAVARGMLILAVVWWCWVGFSWLGNIVRADEGLARIAIFVVMGAVMLMALTIPEAFDDLPGGWSGPVVFAVAYFVVRGVHLVLFTLASRGDDALRRQIMRFAPSVLLGTGLLLAASQVDGPAQSVLWVAALVADYLGTYIAGASGWRVTSPGHFAERHGLIIIIALGESVVAIGVGVSALPISGPIVLATALGLVVVCSLWWLYFDVVSIVARRVLSRAEGAERTRIARDSYSFLHLPMVAGIVLFALGLKKTLEYVGDGASHTLADPLPVVALAGLFGGVALHLAAHLAFRARNVGAWSVHRIVVSVALIVAIPLTTDVPALVALAMLAVVTMGLVVFQAVRNADQRYELRHAEEE